MAVRRTKNGRWRASNGRTYANRKSAYRADRRAKLGSGASKTRKRKHRRVMKGRRRARR